LLHARTIAVLVSEENADVNLESLRDRSARSRVRTAFAELFDDRSKALDLVGLMFDRDDNIWHQAVQKLRIGRQIVEVQRVFLLVPFVDGG
jgi:hypothetical protein